MTQYSSLTADLSEFLIPVYGVEAQPPDTDVDETVNDDDGSPTGLVCDQIAEGMPKLK